MPRNTWPQHHAEKSFTVTQICLSDCNFIVHFLFSLSCALPLPFSQLPSFFSLGYWYIRAVQHIKSPTSIKWCELKILWFRCFSQRFSLLIFFISSWRYTFSGTLPQRHTDLLIAVINFSLYYIRRNSIAQKKSFFSLYNYLIILKIWFIFPTSPSFFAESIW